MRLWRMIGPLKKVPAGISTMPPPAAPAAVMAFWMFVVLSFAPSPTAAKFVTLNMFVGIFGDAGLTAWINPTDASQIEIKGMLRFMNVIRAHKVTQTDSNSIKNHVPGKFIPAGTHPTLEHHLPEPAVAG